MGRTDTMAAAPALPGNVLEDILGRLPPRSLTASRRVCKTWRDLVDRRLLFRLRHLFPHKVSGLFVNYFGHYRPHFLARPAADGAPRIDGKFSFIAREKPFEWHCILDHCNGLILHSGDAFGDYRMDVCNPTTRRWARLPPAPNHDYWDPIFRTFLVFDPAVSPAQWEVLMAPPEQHKKTANAGMKREKRTMEWPPATWRWSAISSSTMEWEEKVFVREGEAAGTVAHLLKHSLEEDYLDEPARWRYGAYCQGALYVHCRGEYITRLSLSTNKYRVIKSPIDLAECEKGTLTSIGMSGNSVCFAAFDNIVELRVWTLNELGDETEWLLKHHTVVITKRYEQRKCDGPWTIDTAKDYYDRETEDDKEVSQLQEDWNSDDDDIMGVADDEDDRHRTYADFLGFHPYKEVIFLRVRGNSAVAYHLNSTKVQYLAELNPGCYNSDFIDSFVYTPCLFGV